MFERVQEGNKLRAFTVYDDNNNNRNRNNQNCVVCLMQLYVYLRWKAQEKFNSK